MVRIEICTRLMYSVMVLGIFVHANRSSRRQRIQSLLENHPSTSTQSARWTFDQPAITLPPVFNTWIRWEPGFFNTTTTTTQPAISPYDQWYYRDDQNYVQGPFPSSTMLEWHRAGYFRSTLLIRREVDNTLNTLSFYTILYGRVPFSRGDYPMAILVASTTISSTTTSRTTTTSSTTTYSTTSTMATTLAATYRSRLHWEVQRVEGATTSPAYRTVRPPAALSTPGPPSLSGTPRTAGPVSPWQPPRSGTTAGQSVAEVSSTPVRGDLAIEDYHNDDEDLNEIEEGCLSEESCKPSLKDGTLRLTGGRDDTEGNLEIYHMGIWGSVCDDEWDKYEAEIVCKKLGFPGAIAPTHGSRFGYGLSTVWMDNVYCYGTEDHIVNCRFDGWGLNDCDRTEAAGVRCKPKPPATTTTTTTTPRPKYPMERLGKDLNIRLVGGRVKEEGRVELSFDAGPWGVICGDGWGVREAMVACRQLGLRYAAAAFSTDLFGGMNSSRLVSGVSCRGNEETLLECQHDQFGDVFCPGEGAEIAGVSCTETQADLEPDLYQLMSSVHLEDKQLFLLQCAMEENCLAKEAYIEQKTNPYWQMLTRRLLRFTAAIANVGNADFRPFIPKSAWDWHACHQHYHSMDTFAHFEIFDLNGQRAAEGHKASFCLEDNDCVGVDPHFNCQNYGDQGITAGCKDIYYYNIDCQWIDVTELALGTYVFKMSINPEYKVPETTFENNAAICTLYYSQMSAMINNCTYIRP